ncbi:non-heme iron oxygenase ferredoxin subunit [Telmatospirillum sp. J64-1]|uniref:non-heme iron oxygenase ferredoxin subunit n=1 Tax=Telmatospirillum sp. J64-1 TaxID=2502183 RepID=UPI00115D9A85|nr:non-heme iron oxygenase ferredoxin subunit [Telmatospirillum sp. J64-1]
MTWKTIASVGQIEEDEPLGVRVEGREIAVFKLGDFLYATDNVCSHQYALLSDGFVDGEYIECPLHQGRFHIPSGKAMGGVVTEAIRTYPCRVEGDQVVIDLPDKDQA